MADDFIDAGSDNDLVLGGGQEDQLLGGDGDDVIIGNSGGDSLDGGLGDDSLFGSDGSDSISGGMGDDQIENQDASGSAEDGENRLVIWTEGYHEIEAGEDLTLTATVDTDAGAPTIDWDINYVDPFSSDRTGDSVTFTWQELEDLGIEDGNGYIIQVRGKVGGLEAFAMVNLQVRKPALNGNVSYVKNKDPKKTNQHTWGHEFEWQVAFPNNAAKGKIGLQLVTATMTAYDSANPETRKKLSTIKMEIQDLIVIDGVSRDRQDFSALQEDIDVWAKKFPKLKYIEFKRQGDWRVLDQIQVQSEGDDGLRDFDPETDKQGAVSIKVTVDGKLKYHKAIELQGNQAVEKENPSYKVVFGFGDPRFRVVWDEEIKSRISPGNKYVLSRCDGEVEFFEVKQNGAKQRIKAMDRTTLRTLTTEY